ncbi:MAG: CotH kinase family protein [Planctomycetota bacterium]|jgi:hypothetical protein|nr:CotH kinase family protein [Planctomycetota bacterium]MDP6941604.1 CotH kinase family protein [Planctomycetota bacterium]
MLFSSLLLLSALPLATPQDLYDETVVRDVRLTFHQSNWWDLLDQNRPSETYIEADLDLDGTVLTQIGVRFKGNSSANVWPSEKMPFKLSLDEFVSGQDYQGYQTINLSNSFKDPTFCREVFTYSVLRKYMPAPKANWVRLWLNGTYWGVYVNIQQVNGDLLEDWYSDDTGNRYKCDHAGTGPPIPNGSALVWLGPDPVDYQTSYELKSDPTGTEWTDLVDMIDALNNQNPSTHVTTLAPLLNVDRSLWYLAACNLFANLDSYLGSGHNYYMYHDPVEDHLDPIPWDWNESFGNFRQGFSVSDIHRLDPYYNIVNLARPLVDRLLYPGPLEGRPRYTAHLRTMFEQEWDWALIEPNLTVYKALIEADVLSDSKKLYSNQNFHDNFNQDVNLGGFIAMGLQSFVNDRQSFLQTHPALNKSAPEISNVTHSPTDPGETDVVTVVASVAVTSTNLQTVHLQWRNGGLYGLDLMFDDGLHGDGAAGDGVFGVEIPAHPAGTKIEYYIRAEADFRVWTFEPRAAEHDPLSYTVSSPGGNWLLTINEFMAKNDTTIADPSGEYDDWIELLNSDSVDADLGGLFITDDATNLTKFPFVAGTLVPSGGTLLLWADEDGSQGDTHLNFKLGGGGEEIYLVDSDGITILDSVVFPSQEDDISCGRFHDGGSPWVSFSTPTPDATNEQSCGYRSYGPMDPSTPNLTLEGIGQPTVNGGVEMKISGLTAGDSVTLYASNSPDYLETLVAGHVVLIDPYNLFTYKKFTADSNGEATLMAAVADPSAIGFSLYCQAYAPFAFAGESISGAVELVICP